MSCGSEGFYVLGVVLDRYCIRGDLLLMNELVFHYPCGINNVLAIFLSVLVALFTYWFVLNMA